MKQVWIPRIGEAQVLQVQEAADPEPAATVDKTFAFAEAAAAHTYIQDRKNFGKVLLVP